MIIPGAPATEGDLALFFLMFCGISLLFACHMFPWASVLAFLTMLCVAVGQIELHAKNDGAGAPAYFAELDLLLEEEQYEDKTKIASAAVQLELASA